MMCPFGADKRIRTADLFLTKEVLCLLSYISKYCQNPVITEKATIFYDSCFFLNGDPNGARTHDL